MVIPKIEFIFLNVKNKKKYRIMEMQDGAISKLLFVFFVCMGKDSRLSSHTEAQTIQQLKHIDLGYISVILRKNDEPPNQVMKQPTKQVANQPTEKSVTKLTKRTNKPTKDMANSKEKSAKLGATSSTKHSGKPSGPGTE